MTPCLNHCDAVRIAADLELSERLGAEILAAECMPEHTVRQEKRGVFMRLETYFSARGGEMKVIPVWITEEL